LYPDNLFSDILEDVLYAHSAIVLTKCVLSTPNIITHQPTSNQDLEAPPIIGYRIRMRNMDRENDERSVKRQKVRGG
jgi:hypothetical protein